MNISNDQYKVNVEIAKYLYELALEVMTLTKKVEDLENRFKRKPKVKTKNNV